MKDHVFGILRILSVAVCICTVMILASGCYRKPTYTPPDIYPVKGKVVSSSGRIPVRAVIQFTTPDGMQTAQGTIAEDGSFTLKTLFHEEWLQGAVEGPKAVQIMMPLGANPQVLMIAEQFTVEPKENNFTVKLK